MKKSNPSPPEKCLSIFSTRGSNRFWWLRGGRPTDIAIIDGSRLVVDSAQFGYVTVGVAAVVVPHILIAMMFSRRDTTGSNYS